MSRPDPRELLFRSFDQAATTMRGVSGDQLGLPTPCTEFDVAALLTHLVGVGHRIAGMGRGEPQRGPVKATDAVATGVWAAAFDATRQEAVASWADDAVLDRKIELPFGTFDGATVASIYSMELTAHTWDLAKATGQVPTLDDELAVAILPIAQVVLPPEQRGGFIPFGAVVTVEPDASPYDRLAAHLGRCID
jgi:uncharacterized protein (TIGR03086 family)